MDELTGAEWAEFLGDEWYEDDDLDDGEASDVCANCGNYGRLTGLDEETYICPVCGEEWDRWAEPPEL